MLMFFYSQTTESVGLDARDLRLLQYPRIAGKSVSLSACNVKA